MVTSAVPARSAPVTTTERTTTALRRSLSVLHMAVAAAALIGGFALLRDASGSQLGLTPAALSGFTSFAIPGALLLVLAFLQLLAAWFVTKRGATGLLISQAAGALLVLWTAVQSALTEPLHPLQLVGLLLGAVIFSVAHELHRNEPHTPLLP